MNGSIHPNSDIDRLYIQRYQGGRGLKSFKTLFEYRIVSLYNHLQIHKNRNEYVNYVYQEEEIESIRVGKKLINKNNIITAPLIHQNKQERNFYDEFKTKGRTYTNVMHRYLRKTIELDQNIDKKESQQWLQILNFIFHSLRVCCLRTRNCY